MAGCVTAEISVDGNVPMFIFSPLGSRSVDGSKAVSDSKSLEVAIGDFKA